MRRTTWYVAASAVVLGGLGCGKDKTTEAPHAAQVVVVTGNTQTAIVGQNVTDSLAVKVLDNNGNPMKGQTVNWSVTSGSGTVSPTSSVTGADGVAKTSLKTGSEGAITVTASVSGVTTPATFGATGKLETFSAQLAGTNEVPASGEAGTGTATFTVNATRDTVSYTITVANLTGAPTASHIHGPAAAGANAAVRIPFTLVSNPPTTGVIATGVFTKDNIVNPTSGSPPPTPLTSIEDVISMLKAGNGYVNVHTTKHPGGEIRGQVTFP